MLLIVAFTTPNAAAQNTKPAATKPAATKPAKVKPPIAAPAPAAPPSVEAFGQIPAVSDVDINPSGSKLAWIDNSGKLARIVIFDLGSNREVREVTCPPKPSHVGCCGRTNRPCSPVYR